MFLESNYNKIINEKSQVDYNKIIQEEVQEYW